MEAWVSRGSLQGRGDWQQLSGKVFFGVNSFGGCHYPDLRAQSPEGWVALGPKTTREGAQPHPSADNWIKALLSKALPTGGRPSFSHHQFLQSGSLHKPLTLFHQRADRRSKNHNPTTIIKPLYRKLISMKKQKVMSQMKGQDKIPEKQLNKVEIPPSRKRIRNNDSEDDSGSWEKNGGKD